VAAFPPPVVVIGIGELGGVFARGFLRLGRPVFPVTRAIPPTEAAAAVPDPELVLVAVSEDDLPGILEALPETWRSRTGLVQNELLPPDWERHGVVDPTVAPVWFEKKPGQDVAIIIPTPIAGPAAPLVAAALATLAIPATPIDRAGLAEALVVKNLYILTANLAGLRVGGTVGELWDRHRPLAAAVAAEVLDLQEARLGTPLPRERLLGALATAVAADPAHRATGRSAPRRLARALAQAARLGVDVPTLASLRHEADASA